jgi:hypothetical protein
VNEQSLQLIQLKPFRLTVINKSNKISSHINSNESLKKSTAETEKTIVFLYIIYKVVDSQPTYTSRPQAKPIKIH